MRADDDDARFNELQGFGYRGGFESVRCYSAAWQRKRSIAKAAAYVPLSLASGEAYPFDRSQEIVVIAGVQRMLEVAHMRLCHGRMVYGRADPRTSQEMVFDLHGRAVAFFGGASWPGVYDNITTAIDVIFFGCDRRCNRGC